MRVVVVMGAAVYPSDQASPAMRRRVAAAAHALAADPQAHVLLTGGRHPWHPSPEAVVMERLIHQAGIAPERVSLESASHDTLSSVRSCAECLAALAATRVDVCTDAYHLPRTRLLFRLHGIRTGAIAVQGGGIRGNRRAWLRTRLKEVVALPLDAVLALIRRRP